MDIQSERGHHVAYFFSGRHYPRVGGPRLKRWRRNGVRQYEVINPPVLASLEDGTRFPEQEIAEPRMEAAFSRVLAEERPDVLHVQELTGLPSSLLEVAEVAGVPTVMTLQDYFPLCTTMRLQDANGQPCVGREIGFDCLARNANAPSGAGHLVKQTLQFETDRARRLLHVSPDVSFAALAPAIGAISRRLGKSGTSESKPPAPADESALAARYQRRRDVNVERLSRVDRLIAQSARVAEMYADRGVATRNLGTLPFTLRHVEALRPRRLHSPPARLTFGTLNGCASPTKGSRVVVSALRALREAGLEGRFRLLIFGWVDPEVLPDLGAFDGVEVRGEYSRTQLGTLLDEVDVGLLPSTWEEAFGYVGLEMIAKGIPLIANPLGGIVNYAIEDQTAWLNRSCSGEELARIMAKLIAEPQLVLELHRRLLQVRAEHIFPMGQHVDQLEEIYSAVGRG